MNTLALIFVLVAVMILIIIFAMPYLWGKGASDNYKDLMGDRYVDEDAGADVSQLSGFEMMPQGVEQDIMRSLSRKKISASTTPTLEEQMFRAGLFSAEQRADFRRLQIILPIVLAIAGAVFGFTSKDSTLLIVFPLIGIISGAYIPLKILEKWVENRKEEMMFYLPLVIEQIAIGVSSSLDIGPCISRVVQMAEDRDSHNPVTELLRFAQSYIKSGASLSDALIEIGKQSGSNEVKHSFRAMAQVARYGGEISRQLQDLSEAVSSERDTKIDEKIKKLELTATGPVALVFLGYFIILLMGFGTTLLRAVGG